MAEFDNISDDALLSSLGPAPAAAHTPAAFIAQHAGTAASAGQQLGVDPNLLLAQWGLETGWGKSVVPGTNNLGNVKDFSGGGVAATDNATGTTDNYRAYSSPDAFATDQANLLARKYPGVVGAGSDVGKFANGLQGYAEDPQYPQKLAAVVQTVQRNQPQAAPQQPSMLARVGDAVASAISGTANAATPQELSGISDADLLAALAARGNPQAQQQPGFLEQVGHQIGRTARAVGHGVADAAGFVANPVNAAINSAGALIGHDPHLQDVDTLIRRGVDAVTPDAWNGTEQTVGQLADAVANPVNLVGAEIMAPAAGALSTLGRGALAGAVTGGAQPLHGSDTVGDFAGRVAGGAAGGAAGAVVGGAVGAVADRLATGVDRLVSAVRSTMPSTRAAARVNADELIQQAAQDQNIDISAIPQSILAATRQRVTDALSRDGTIDAAALLRRAEGDAVLGPDSSLTLGQATRDPTQFTLERNTRGKIGGEQLAQRYADQNRGLIDALNNQGALEAPGEYQAGQGVMNALAQKDAEAQKGVSSLYSQANAIHGNDVPLDADAFVSEARDQLAQQMRDLHLPPSVDRQLTKFVGRENAQGEVQSPETPLTVSTAEQFKSILGQDIADAEARGKGNVVSALGIVRKALDNAQPLLGGEADQGAAALAAFNKARAVAKERFDTIDAVPALNAVVSGKAVPDTFFNRFVLNGNVGDINAMLNIVPDQGMALRRQMVDYLKQKALGGASDEVGTFSQSGYNKALNSIGTQKLNALFDPGQVAQLKQIGRVAANVQAEPAGSAVNHSNTAAAISNSAVNALLSIAEKVPGIRLGAGVAKNMFDQTGNRRLAQEALAGQAPVTVERSSIDPVNQLLPFLPGIVGAAAVPARR
ncbi:glucosaminidase domain-containing protein [Paraburkholderia sp. Ac-20342]|uniref:glycoside hydrolase family 73 protein n=1 Tax=Paraburkholderia sp. Ac-20342 TaxID=2703889 RepID=UPI0019801F25|nr:glucosaminidase domain-containing protein [Paraburkholderia sp. Ac-20342]MBN3848140.1 glucosaminidase domain-containing protein [Paraburkholderia sp. Ac-20342]